MVLLPVGVFTAPVYFWWCFHLTGLYFWSVFSPHRFDSGRGMLTILVNYIFSNFSEFGLLEEVLRTIVRQEMVEMRDEIKQTLMSG